MITRLTLVILMLISYSLNAQSYSKGYQKYKQGQFSNAIRILKSTLRKRTNKQTKARSLKIIGISQYILNKKTAAKKSFTQAVMIYPRLTIRTSEVLDESVIAYFNNIKRLYAPSKKLSRKTKKTRLKIVSNVQGSVSIDGIIAGRTGIFIETDPGLIIATVSKSRYITKKIKVKISKNKDNLIKVALAKPRPKPKPKPKVRRRVKKRVAVAKRRPVRAKRRVKTTQKNPLFDDVTSDYSDYQAPQQTVPPLPQRFRQAPAPQAYQAPPPVYTPPPPTYYAPPPAYYPPPPQQSYYAPPPPPPPPPAPLPTLPGDNSGSSLNSLDSGTSSRPRYVKSKTSLMQFLPLGLPQIHTSSYTLALVFTALQIGGGYFYYTSDKEVKSILTTADEIKKERAAGAENYAGYTDEEINSYLEELSTESKAWELKANLGLGAIAGGYVLSVVESFINPKKVKRKRRRKSNSFGILNNQPLNSVPRNKQNWYESFKYNVKPYIVRTDEDKYKLNYSLKIGITL